jgi:ABC-type metal ion transport system substrate-binding protein
VIAIPIDGANQGQALWLLEREGLIGLDKDIEPKTAKIKNIVDNPRKFRFKELDLLTMPRVLDSIDAGITYVSLFDAGKISREKGILFPKTPRTFASRLVIGTRFLNDPYIKKLQEAFADPRVQEYLRTTDDPLVQGVLTPVSDN